MFDPGTTELPDEGNRKLDEAEMRRLRKLYAERYADAKKHVKVEIALMTPEWAAKILEKQNTHNRGLGKTWERIYSAILRDAWQFTGETICFDRNGVLVNGQNRLTGIVAAGVPVPILIVYNVPDGAFEVTDLTRKRTAADVLGIEGSVSCTTLSKALNWIDRWERKKIESPSYEDRSLLNDRALDILKAHPTMPDSVRWSQAQKHPPVPPALLAFLHYLLIRHAPDDATVFFARVIQGIEVQKDSWEFVLARVLKTRGPLHGTDHGQVATLALFLKAFGGIRRNDPPKTVLTWRSEEKFPELV